MNVSREVSAVVMLKCEGKCTSAYGLVVSILIGESLCLSSYMIIFAISSLVVKGSSFLNLLASLCGGLMMDEAGKSWMFRLQRIKELP